MSSDQCLYPHSVAHSRTAVPTRAIMAAPVVNTPTSVETSSDRVLLEAYLYTYHNSGVQKMPLIPCSCRLTRPSLKIQCRRQAGSRIQSVSTKTLSTCQTCSLTLLCSCWLMHCLLVGSMVHEPTRRTTTDSEKHTAR